jgi:hypothetical protein
MTAATFTKSGHTYADDGRRLPSITTILKAYPKEGLIKWSADKAGEYVVNHWDALADMTLAERGKVVSRAYLTERGEAMLRGKQIHALGEALAREGEVTGVPDRHVGMVEAYARWLDRWHVLTHHVERPILNRTHGYAGTFDLLATLGNTRWLLDLKTGNSAGWPDHALQIAAYRFAETMLDEAGIEVPMPQVQRCGVVWVQSDDVSLIEVDASRDTFRTFLAVKHLSEWIAGYDRPDALPDPPSTDEPAWRLLKVHDMDGNAA